MNAEQADIQMLRELRETQTQDAWMFRYAIAIITACTLVGSGLLFSWYWRHRFDGLDGLDVEVTSVEIRLLEVAALLSRFWFVWIPLVIGLCVGIAYLAGLAAPRSEIECATHDG